jgi:hypothetical protein
MKYMKIKLNLFLAFLLISVTKLHAIQIIPEAPKKPSTWDSLSFGLNKAARDLPQTMERYYAMKEQEEKEKDKKIANKILKKYSPSRHSDFILEVTQSELSSHAKREVIDFLNEQHKIYKRENKQSFWSKFRGNR